VPIRDLETILETVGNWAARTKDPDILTEYARNALARTIAHAHKADDGKIHCATFDPAVEQIINKSLERGEHGTTLLMPPELQKRIVEAIRVEIEQATPRSGGRPPVLLCAPQIRSWVRRMIEVAMPAVGVLSYNEIVRGIEVESHGMVAISDEA